MNTFLWGVFPYICFILFFSVPIARMIFRPYGWTTRASSLFSRRLLGVASLLFHWGLFLVLVGHLVGWVGGLFGLSGWVGFFFWLGLVGGLMTVAGSLVALWRRFVVPEVRAMSQAEDYIIHFFLIAIIGLGLYQVLVDRIFGVAYTAAPWFASIWTFSPQPELMASATFISQLHIFLALAFFGYFPFTKLVHFWALPVNYFVRPYQSMRTARFWAHKKWEFSLRSDKSYLLYAMATVVVVAIVIAVVPKNLALPGGGDRSGQAIANSGELSGYPLYVSQCARCHGLEGEGDGPGANSPTFAGRPRNLVLGAHRFVSTDNGVASDADLTHVLVAGLPSAGMPGFAELSEAQVRSLVDILGDLWVDRPVPGTPIEIAVRPSPSADLRAAGKDLFANSCAVCHGDSGRGDGVASGVSSDDDGLPVPAANLAAGELKAGRQPEQIYTRIAAGVANGSSGYFMPPFGYLSGEEIWSLVEYLEHDLLP